MGIHKFMFNSERQAPRCSGEGESNLTKVMPKEVQMTPEKAAKILEKNNKNRPLSRVTVRRYSQTMTAGKWFLNGEPIIIAEDGTLIDGQHRLHAVVDSGVTVPIILVTGVHKRAFRTIDIGKKRTGADALATQDQKFEKNRMVIAAAAKVVCFFGKDGIFKDERARISNDELIDFVESNKGILRSVEYALTLTTARKIVPASALAGLHYLFCKKDLDQAERFFHRLNSGENMQKDDPVRLLRDRLFILSQEIGVIRAREVIPMITKAWEIVREGKTVDRIRIDPGYVAKII